ncbi:MAG TPA: hypothetical protein GXZ52_00980 [Clostridiales bacterium]|nr:hypothetical protein [Clostridiales bacterium]
MKTRKFNRTTAFFLVLSLLLTGAAWASVLGDRVDGAGTNLGVGMKLARGVYWTGSDFRTENYVEYTPNSTVFPVITYGSKILSYGSFSNMADQLRAKGYHVIAGINGDYFNTSDYQPLGIVITDGILRSSDGGHWAVGFRDDGTAIIGRPALKTTLTLCNQNYPVSTINKTRTTYNYALYTENYASTTRNSTPGHDVIVSVIDGGDLTVNCELTLLVEEILESDGPVDIPQGKMVLSLAETADEWRQYGIENLKPGDTATLKVSCDPEWDDVKWAVGSLYKLVTNGNAESGLEAAAAPRTAIGIKTDGTLVLYTIDGRKSGHSVGATMTQVANRLIELGCVEAAIMDGGGSTSLNAMYIGDSSLSQINSPSGGYQRAVTNYIMLVTKEKPTGIATQLAIYPYSVKMLSGATVSFTAKSADEFGFAAPLTQQVNYSVTEGLGVIGPDGVFKASGSGTGAVSVTAEGLAGADAALTVIYTPDRISIKNEATGKTVSALEIQVEQSVDLTAEAIYNRRPLISSDDCYDWSVEGDIGGISATGIFTASDRPASGSINVSAGDKSVTIPVKVVYPPGRFEDVAQGAWYFDAVSFVVKEGLFNGVSDTEFCPDENMSRAMFATVLHRLAGSPKVYGHKGAFTDVAAGKWYSDAIVWASQNGIVKGYDDGSFRPDDDVTREQMAAILYRYAAWAGHNTGVAADLPFRDSGAVSSYARAAVEWAVGAKLINGMEREGALIFAPQESATRAQVATIMQRFKQSLT